MMFGFGVINIDLGGLAVLTVSGIGVIVWLVRQEGRINLNKSGLEKLEKSVVDKVDKLEKSVSDKMDKFEIQISTIEKQGQDTKINMAVIESDTKHIRDSIHSLINLFNQHVLTKEIAVMTKDD